LEFRGGFHEAGIPKSRKEDGSPNSREEAGSGKMTYPKIGYTINCKMKEKLDPV